MKKLLKKLVDFGYDLAKAAANYPEKRPPVEGYPMLTSPFPAPESVTPEDARPPVKWVWHTSIKPGDRGDLVGFNKVAVGDSVRIYYPCIDENCPGRIHIAQGVALAVSSEQVLLGNLSSYDDGDFGKPTWGARYNPMIGIEVYVDGHGEQCFVMQAIDGSIIALSHNPPEIVIPDLN